eukprot:scaffold280112_cov35-Tisochrysis_lutea.AAC.1
MSRIRVVYTLSFRVWRLCPQLSSDGVRPTSNVPPYASFPARPSAFATRPRLVLIFSLPLSSSLKAGVLSSSGLLSLGFLPWAAVRVRIN